VRWGRGGVGERHRRPGRDGAEERPGLGLGVGVVGVVASGVGGGGALGALARAPQ
jgi:hypothetical protein